MTISHLTASLRRQARIATLRERRTGAMFAMARELGAALTTAQIIEIGTRHVAEVFQARVAILLPDSAEKVKQKLENPDESLTLDTSSVDALRQTPPYARGSPAASMRRATHCARHSSRRVRRADSRCP